MPRAQDVGTTFSTAPLHFGWQGGYGMRVLSIADGTTINVPAVGQEVNLDAGEFLEFVIPANSQGALITCSQPCIAAQFANQAFEGSSPGERHMNPFMLILTPVEHYSVDVVFSTPSFETSTLMAMSIIVDFYPVEDLYLDEVSLEDLEWQPTVGSTDSYHVSLSLEPGQHTLYTLDPDHK